jgi:hypothetical protein
MTHHDYHQSEAMSSTNKLDRSAAARDSQERLMNKISRFPAVIPMFAPQHSCGYAAQSEVDRAVEDQPDSLFVPKFIFENAHSFAVLF